MYLLLRLILSHIIADFPLQTNAIYKLKTTHIIGQILHGLVFIILSLLLIYPYNFNFGIIIFIIIIGFFHIVQDHLKLVYWNKKIKSAFLSFILDQFIHFTLIFGILFFNIKDLFKENINESNIFINLFCDNNFIIILTCILTIIFANKYFSEFLRISYLPSDIFYNKKKPLIFFNIERLEGLILFFSIIVKGIYIIPNIIFIILIRYFSNKYILSNEFKKEFNFIPSIILNYFICILLGIISSSLTVQ